MLSETKRSHDAADACYDGFHSAVRSYFDLAHISPLDPGWPPPDFSGNFFIAYLPLFRARAWTGLSRFIADNTTGLYSHRWGEQALLYLPFRTLPLPRLTPPYPTLPHLTTPYPGAPLRRADDVLPKVSARHARSRPCSPPRPTLRTPPRVRARLQLFIKGLSPLHTGRVPTSFGTCVQVVLWFTTRQVASRKWSPMLPGPASPPPPPPLPPPPPPLLPSPLPRMEYGEAPRAYRSHRAAAGACSRGQRERFPPSRLLHCSTLHWLHRLSRYRRTQPPRPWLPPLLLQCPSTCHASL